MDIDNMRLTDIWEIITDKANEHLEFNEGLSSSYGFELTGEDGGHFGLLFTPDKVVVLRKELTDADCGLKMSVENFKKLLQGNLNSATAFMTGQLKVKGNLNLALQLEKLLKKYAI